MECRRCYMKQRFDKLEDNDRSIIAQPHDQAIRSDSTVGRMSPPKEDQPRDQRWEAVPGRNHMVGTNAAKTSCYRIANLGMFKEAPGTPDARGNLGRPRMRGGWKPALAEKAATGDVYRSHGSTVKEERGRFMDRLHGEDDRQVSHQMYEKRQLEPNCLEDSLPQRLHMVGWREHQALIAEGRYRCPECCRPDITEVNATIASLR